MTLPNNLVLVRHGESDGNFVMNREKEGDTSHFTEEYMTTPGHRWRLTPRGREQAAAIGGWIGAQFPTFDRYMFSPFVRCRETAGLLGLPGAQWRLVRELRERDWGDIGSLPRSMFETDPLYARNAAMKAADPLYWVPPGGESIAHTAENRVREVCTTLARELSDAEAVIGVAHGELMWAFRLFLERLDDETFVTLDANPAERIHNCEALNYSRTGPDGSVDRRYGWMRRAYPADGPSGLMVVESDWAPIDIRLLSNEELLASVAPLPSLSPAL